MKLKCDSKKFLKVVKNTIDYYDMLSNGDKVLIGVSGGADSMALLHVMMLLSGDYGIKLGVAHLNHKLRGISSYNDVSFVESVAKKLSLPFYYISADVIKVKEKLKLSIEETARRIRYAFFRKLLIQESYSKVALAHHMEDNAELILMFMLRGSGSLGLSGISPFRDDYLIRPLIDVYKKSIKKFLKDENIDYIEDESNFDLRFLRNKVRHGLVPLLKKSFNPRIVEKLNNMANIIADENSFIDEFVTIAYKKVLIERNVGRIVLSVPVLKSLHHAIQRRILRKVLLLLYGSLKRISFSHIEASIQLLVGNLGIKYVCLPFGMRISKIYDYLEIAIKDMRKFKINFTLIPPVIDFFIFDRKCFPLILSDLHYEFKFSVIKIVNLPEWSSVDSNFAFFDIDMLRFPLLIRPKMSGDFFNPLGMKGTQKLKKYFINKKIFQLERSRALVLEDNDRIVWLVGHVICDYVKVTNKTKEVVMVEFSLLKDR